MMMSNELCLFNFTQKTPAKKTAEEKVIYVLTIYFSGNDFSDETFLLCFIIFNVLR